MSTAMAPLHGHPAVDIATAGAAVVVQDREVVGMGPLLLDALVSAPRAGVRLQLVTPPTSRLTLPLVQLLRDNEGQWVVRRDDGSCFDGLSGRLLRWDGRSFEPEAEPAADPGWASPPAPDRGCFAADLTVLHPATSQLLLGESVETCCAALTGLTPGGWGVAEPVSQRWDRAALTALCRERAPQPTLVVVVGGSGEAPVVGTLTITPTTSGVRERLVLQAPAGSQVTSHPLDALAERLAGQDQPPRTALLGLQPGPDDGTIRAQHGGATVPYGLLLGPAVLKEIGTDRALAAPVPAVRLVGPAAASSVWARLLPESGTADPGGALGRLWRHLGLPAPG